MRVGQESDVNSTRKTGFQLDKDLFFLRSPKFGQKNQLNFSVDLFFLRSRKFGQKNRLNLSEDQSKCGSRSFHVVSSLQNNPTPMQIPGYAPVDTDSLQGRNQGGQCPPNKNFASPNCPVCPLQTAHNSARYAKNFPLRQF